MIFDFYSLQTQLLSELEVKAFFCDCQTIPTNYKAIRKEDFHIIGRHPFFSYSVSG